MQKSVRNQKNQWRLANMKLQLNKLLHNYRKITLKPFAHQLQSIMFPLVHFLQPSRFRVKSLSHCNWTSKVCLHFSVATFITNKKGFTSVFSTINASQPTYFILPAVWNKAKPKSKQTKDQFCSDLDLDKWTNRGQVPYIFKRYRQKIISRLFLL